MNSQNISLRFFFCCFFLKVNQLTAFSFCSFHFWIYENDCGFFCAWRKTALAYLCPTPCQQSHPHASSCLQHSASHCLLQCCAKWTTRCKSFLAFLDTIKGILPSSSFFFLFPLHLECTVIRSKHGYYLSLCCTDQRGRQHGKFTVHEMKKLRGFIWIVNFMNSDGSGAFITTKKSSRQKKKKEKRSGTVIILAETGHTCNVLFCCITSWHVQVVFSLLMLKQKFVNVSQIRQWCMTSPVINLVVKKWKHRHFRCKKLFDTSVWQRITFSLWWRRMGGAGAGEVI